MRAGWWLPAVVALAGGCEAFRTTFGRGRADSGGVADRANQSARSKDFGFAWDDKLAPPRRRGDEPLAVAKAPAKPAAGNPSARAALPAVADRGSGPADGGIQPVGGMDNGGPTGGKYAAFRDRLDVLGAAWSSEKSGDGRRVLVRCEVPYPGDPSHARVFESSSPDELAALNAAVTQAERWHAAKGAAAPKTP